MGWCPSPCPVDSLWIVDGGSTSWTHQHHQFVTLVWTWTVDDVDFWEVDPWTWMWTHEDPRAPQRLLILGVCVDSV